MSKSTSASAEAPATTREKMILFLTMGGVLLVDQGSKYLIESNLAMGDKWVPIPALEPFFKITHTMNTGAAFGMFPNGSLIFGIAAVLVAIFILYYNQTLQSGNPLLRVALGLMLGGALGNLIDRIRLGYVTDFLDFGPWPVFNIADAAIVGGVIVMGWLMLQEYREEKKLEQANNG